jgi:exopolyphosphatase/pppGpp-phosphohydrolase
MSDRTPFTPEQQVVYQAVLRLAQTCEYEVLHTGQVTFLAVRLFEELAALHRLGDLQKAWLVYAGTLHDIGWIEGWKEHHKVSLRIILTTSMLPFSNKERLIIGSIARYHRKTLPSLKHDHYAALSTEERRQVSLLAAFLRLADALDRTHHQRVRDLTCQVKGRRIIVICQTTAPAPEEAAAVLEKGDLLQKVLNRKLMVEGLV